MTFFNKLLLFGVCATIACGPSGGDDGTSSGSSSSSNPAGSSIGETGSDETSASPTSTGTTEEPGTPTTTADPTTTTTDDSTTGTDDECTLEHHSCEAVAMLGDFTDCGHVDPQNDDTAAWQAAQACALSASSQQQAFCLRVDLQGIDSFVGQAWTGEEARSYAIATQFFDSDPCGGGGCGPVVHTSSCASLTATPGCTIEPGTICLTCADPSNASQACGP